MLTCDGNENCKKKNNNNNNNTPASTSKSNEADEEAKLNGNLIQES